MLGDTTEVTFDATPEQIAMMEDPAHVKIWACGRRWGKSILMAILMAITSLRHDDCTVWYVSPRYARSLKMMRIMKKCKPFMELVANTHMQFPPRFEMKNGSEICFISADREEELRGEGLRLICTDEAGILSKHLFEDILMPMTADSGGTIIAGSTFNGRNWFYDKAVSGMPASDRAKTLATGIDPDVKTWIYPTSTGYAFKGTTEKVARFERMRKNTGPMTWKQEYECEPLATVDAVFTYVDQCVVQAIPIEKPERGHRYVLSHDLGRSPDRAGVTVMDLDTGEFVYAEQYPEHMKHSEQAARTRDLGFYWSATGRDTDSALIVLDTTGGASGGRDESHIKEYAEVITQGFRSVTFTQDTKRNMVGQLQLDMENMRVKIPYIFNEFVSQLKLYRYHWGEKSIQPQFFGRPDHLVSSALMAVHARAKKWGPEIGAMPLSMA